MLKRTNLIVSTLLFSLVFVSLLSVSTSPIRSGYHIDSDIFQYMGYALACGKIPYVDYFDHKGLVLYGIQALGWIIDKHWGVWLLQVLNLTATLLTWYASLVFVDSRRMRLGVAMIAALTMSGFYVPGNTIGEWTLLPLSLPMMFYFRSVAAGKQMSWWQLLLIGLCLGAALQTRVNNAAPLCALLFYCAFVAIRERQWRYLAQAVALVLTGTTIVVGATMLTMYALGGWRAVDEMWYATVGFNFEYVQRFKPEGSDLRPLLWCIKAVLVAGVPCTMMMTQLKRLRQYIVPLIVCFLLTVPTIGRAAFNGYYMVFATLIALSLGTVSTMRKRWALILAMVLALVLYPCVRRAKLGSWSMAKDDTVTLPLQHLMSNVSEQYLDSIWNYNGLEFMHSFALADVQQVNRVFLDFQYDISPRLRKEDSGRTLQKLKPKYVFVCADKMKGKGYIWIAKRRDMRFVLHNYTLRRTERTSDKQMLLCLYERK